jgi:neutral ceramidase
MFRTYLGCLLVALAFSGCMLATNRLAFADEVQLAKLQASFAERDITPEIGMEQPGNYMKSFHTKLHDACKVRAAVFGQDAHRVAVVSVDALLVRRELVTAARDRIQEQCGIEANAILIHATHSHSSGPTGMIYPGDFDHASDQIQHLAYERSSNANLDYVRHVENQIVDAVVSADAERSHSIYSAGVGHEDKVAFNRRFFMANGITQTHPALGNPDILGTAGPVDPEVGVLGIWDQENKLKGCLVNFSCHATASPPGISANYIFYVEQVIRGVFGPQCILVFLAGASGDVTQVENVSPYTRREDEDSSRFVGGCIGAEAIKVLLREPKGDQMTIAFQSKLLKIPRRPPSAQHVQEAFEIVAQEPAAVGQTKWVFAKETVLLDAKLQKEPIADVEVQAVQLGPVVLLTDPAEFFCQFGLDIKAGSPFPITFPVSLANGCVGYVPTPEAFGKRGGGYETRLTSYSNLEITAGTKMVDAAIELAKSMKPDLQPTRPLAPEFKGNAWEYGSIPPQLD